MQFNIFTDGSSRGNPGPGGWGAVIVSHDGVVELGGRKAHTTNNAMELTAAIEALDGLPSGAQATVHTDSSYVINGITKWIKGWKQNGWVTRTKQEVMNADLWSALDRATSSRRVTWKYVGGHVGILGNERCDEIATALADERDTELYKGPLSGYGIPNILDISLDQEKAASKKSGSSRSNAKAYSYVSMVGGVIQTHATWPECEKRVKGTKGARYKKAVSAADERAVISEFKGI